MSAEAKLAKVQKKIRQGLIKHGTKVEVNDADPCGDGDQSIIDTGGFARQQFYRNLYGEAGDINYLVEVGLAPLSSFARHCIAGTVTAMRRMLQEADTDPTKPSEALVQLLEKRETTQRLSPLLMTVGIGKNVQLSADSLVPQHLKAVELLLEYGARPDARDVCGKTVCHYGLGAFATEMTMKACEYCIAAHQSSHLFGKEVELHSLSTTELNGLRGICRGYIVSTGRRMVHLHDRNETKALKPMNLKLVNGDSNTVTVNLCDIQDRLKGVALIEVLMANRLDVAKVLLDQHNASIDIVNVEGLSPKIMAAKAGALSQVGGMIMKSAMRKSRAEHVTRQKTCANCGRVDDSLTKCGRCLTVCYCSRNCQVAHWKAGHKGDCVPVLDEKQFVSLKKPRAGGMSVATFSVGTGSLGAASRQQPTRTMSDSFRKPSNVAYGEQFYIKIQAGGVLTPLLLYDQSREFQTTVNPSDPAFDQLRAKVVADPAADGRKTYLKCSFDNQDSCSIFLNTRSAKLW